jgi:hypothetical protein
MRPWNKRPVGSAIAALALAFWPAVAAAVPPEASANANDDDATITIWVDSATIPGDSRSRCKLRFEDAGADIAFSDGDTVELWVYEDDAVADDVLWSTSFAVNRGDLVNGGLTREFDCSSAFGADGVGTLELYADAHVTKSECGFLCLDDTPTTANIGLAEIEDDGNEEDDARPAAHGLALGRNNDRVARDQDWQSVELQSRSHVTLRALHRPEAGRLDVVLIDAAGQQVAQGVDEAAATVLDYEPLDAGTWYFRVSAREQNDFAFYDLQFGVDTLAGDCSPGDTESQPCGNCGMQTRGCDPNGRWLAFDACVGEGECAPNATRSTDCGRCGTSTDTCTAACQWMAGACDGEGVCEPGAEDEQDCPEGGTHVRTCGDACQWGQYGECGGAECEAGATRECYTGPEGTRSVGVCRPGAERCVAGRWAPCEGQVVPTIEACEDGRDNDCDGAVDAEDDNCGGAPQIGDPCENDAQCSDSQVCLQAPAHPQFPDGYCGVVPCQEDCGDGAACVGLFGRQYCLRGCAADRDCREGYRCLEVQPGDRVCAPPCDADSDCGDVRRPVCDLNQGLCVARSAGTPDMGTTPPTAPPTTPGTLPPPGTELDAGIPGGGPGPIIADPDGGTSSGGSASSTSAGCSQTTPVGGRLPYGWLALVSVLALRRRRR